MYRYSALLILLALLAGPAQATQLPSTVSQAPSSWSLTAVGDIMLDRDVWKKIQTKGTMYPFEKIKNQLAGTDIVLGNLEGPFTTSKKHSVAGGALSFTFDPSMAPILKKVGLTTLLLGNNHTLNQGQRGLDGTRALLKKNGLDYFGDPRNGRNFHLTKILNGEAVTFLGYDNLDGKIANVLIDVQNAHRKGEYVIVVPHWGAEYQLGIQPRLQQQAKQLIDAGADMILGGHPHVVEPFEIYKGKFIAYSLGNFVFDQAWSTPTQEELLLKIHFTTTSISVTLVPLVSVAFQPQLSTGKKKSQLLNRLAQTSIVNQTTRDGIRTGSFTLSR